MLRRLTRWFARYRRRHSPETKAAHARVANMIQMMESLGIKITIHYMEPTTGGFTVVAEVADGDMDNRVICTSMVGLMEDMDGYYRARYGCGLKVTHEVEHRDGPVDWSAGWA